VEEQEKTNLLKFLSLDWETSVRTLWPDYTTKPFASFHQKTWEWADQTILGEQHSDHIAIWPRGYGKSTTAEMIVAYLGITRKRRYAWYICGTQQAADDHILAIGDLLISENVKKYFPSIAKRNIDVEGVKEGWRRNRLITQDGFTIDAVGMDVAIRGRKIGTYRPDLMILDDLDEHRDTPEITQKKQETLANGILPAGPTGELIVLGAQNLISATGIFAQLADGTSPILTTADINGPIPAIYNLKTQQTYQNNKPRTQIIEGTSSWPDGMTIQDCQRLIDQIGIQAFLLECQHEVYQTQGASWAYDDIIYGPAPSSYDEISIGVDPAMSSSPKADDTGIYIVAKKGDLIYVLENHSCHLDPPLVKQKILQLWQKYQTKITIEIDNGGQWLTDSLIEAGIPKQYINPQKTGGKDKWSRHQPLADKYKKHEIIHTQKFEMLEKQMVTWVPSNGKSPDHIDALVWACSRWLKPTIQGMKSYGTIFTR